MRPRLLISFVLTGSLFACAGRARLPEQSLKPWIVEAVATSSESRHYSGEFAFDGDRETRWSSQFADNQVLTARFGAMCGIRQIVIAWEAACASDYVVELSEDQKTWKQAASRTGWTGGTDTIVLAEPMRAGYMRLRCLKRTTAWGNSIFEIDLFGSPEAEPPGKSLLGFEAAPSPWDKRCREARDMLMKAAASDPKKSAGMSDDQFLELVSRRAFDYFWWEANPENGLVLDQAENFRSSESRKIASTAAVGFGLTAYAIGAERGWVTRNEAAERVRKTLSFYLHSAAHNHGFYYHFLDMFTGNPEEGTELSSIDSALFFCGVITVAREFSDDTDIVRLAGSILDRVDWKWMLNGHPHFPAHGADPSGKFLNARWGSTTEGMLCYILGIGAGNNPMPPESWRAFDRHKGSYGGHEFFVEYGAQSIFRFQYPCLWYDFRGRHDGIADYFQNGVEATLAMRQYCIDKAKDFPKSYGPDMWGLGAANGPGDKYLIYGFPPGEPEAPVDGTVVVYAIGGSTPFTPEYSIAAMRRIYDRHHESWGKHGFTDAVNPTLDFVTRRTVGLDQGTLLLAIENHRSGYVWKQFMSHPMIERATKRIGWKSSPPRDDP